jgi:hypothetical protein
MNICAFWYIHRRTRRTKHAAKDAGTEHTEELLHELMQLRFLIQKFFYHRQQNEAIDVCESLGPIITLVCTDTTKLCATSAMR